MEKGTKVRMNDYCKQRRSKNSPDHVEEFGDCVGVVIGPADLGAATGPEEDLVDVRWPSPHSPHGFRYMYGLDELEAVE